MLDLGLDVLFKGKNMARLLGGLGVARNGGAARHPSKINLAMYNYCKTMQK